MHVDSHPSLSNRLAGGLLGIAMLLLIHRYWGIDHDATLYLGESLRRLHPDIYDQDLYFLFGSQGKFTLFPWVLAQLMQLASPVPLFKWGGLTGLLLFAWASWFCIKTILPVGQRYWAWLGVLCLPSLYGRTIIFSYAEPFLTPRPFSEALSLLAVGFAFRKSTLASLACLLLAGLLHPLPALACALILWPWAILHDRRWLHALWLTLPIAGAALMGIAPFDGLFTRIDANWWAELHGITGQLFVTGWPQLDYQYMALDVALLAYAWRHQKKGFGRLCLAALAGLALGVGSSLLLVDLMHLALPTGLQLWRAHWLAHWLAMAVFALQLHAALADKTPQRAALLMLCGLLCWSGFAWVWLPFFMLYAAWQKIGQNLQPRSASILSFLFMTGISLLLIHYISINWIPFKLNNYQLESFAIDRRLLAYPLLGFGLPFLAAMLWMHGNENCRRILACAGLPILFAIVYFRWDIQTPQHRELLLHADNSTLFGTSLPADAKVYWHDMSLVATWLVLGRSDYYDPQQLSGIVFNAETIREARRRLTRIGPMIEELQACKASRPDGSYTNCKISANAFMQACKPGPVSRPDFLVLPFDSDISPAGRWQKKRRDGKVILADWYLYNCDVIYQTGLQTKDQQA